MINHNTMHLVLKMPGKALSLGLPIGQHLKIFGKDKNNNQISRSYTPISLVTQKGEIDLLIKVYFPNERFKEGGAMSQYLYYLEKGSRLKISGPKGMIKYKGNGYFKFLFDGK